MQSCIMYRRYTKLQVICQYFSNIHQNTIIHIGLIVFKNCNYNLLTISLD